MKTILKMVYIGAFIEKVKKEYPEKTGIEAEIYFANIGDGARKLNRKFRGCVKQPLLCDR